MVETPDPTSIEFESTFRDLMHEALGDHPTRRLVLVVDNLDRVSPRDARSIWATLQTFLHHSHDEQESWLSSLWVVLPYDRDGIARLWHDPAPENDDKAIADETVDDEAVDNESLRQVPLVDSFIDKSIQVRFEVPLPLVSDWRAYLEATLELSLPKCDEADGYTAYRLYAHRSAGTGQAPSPREIKQYTNRIGALHRRWQHSLPFTSLAYYASLGLDGTRVADRLRRGTLPEPGPADLLGDDVDAHLAAIAFNADPERARQLLLGPLLDRGLGRDTSENWSNFLTDQGPGKRSCSRQSCSRAWELQRCSKQLPALWTFLRLKGPRPNGKKLCPSLPDRALREGTGLHLRLTRQKTSLHCCR